MKAVEIIVILAVCVITVGLIIAFLSGWDIGKGADDVGRLFSGQTEKKPLTVTREMFLNEVYLFWQNCSNESRSFYLDQEGLLTKSGFFDDIKSLSWCDSLQSAANNCGAREDVNMTDILLPKIITIECREETLYIE